ncbi:hypothetical protein [Sinomicrobium sp.]
MKRVYFISCMFFLFIGLSNANAQYVQAEPEEKIFPTQVFDSVAAKKGLVRGTTTLTGVAYAQLMRRKYYPRHIDIELFPHTPYFEE